MARVEWTVLEGGQVETLMSNLIYNWSSRSLRVRPSQGDFGIDIILPTEADPSRWDVYQVKKFAQNLTAGQKTQIITSFARVLIGMLRRDVQLNDWYLVLPLDPTLENLDWLKGVPDAAIAQLKRDKKLKPKLSDEELHRIDVWLRAPGRIIGWKGLDFCEGLAAKYPYVVDYYAHGGSERLRTAMSDMAKLIDLDRKVDEAGAKPSEGSVALIEPGEISKHLAALHAVLDTDPHYRYGISLDAYEPQFRPEPWLVTAQFKKVADDRWISIKIYARSEQSIEERPIPLNLTFEIESGSEEERAFKEWLKFGKPFDGLTATVDRDLPGGLGSGQISGEVSLLPVDDGTPAQRLRQRIVDPDGNVLAEIALSVRSTAGPQGRAVRTYGSDTSGLLSIEWLLDPDAEIVTMNYHHEPLAGLEASKVLAAVMFARYLHAPNMIQTAAEYGPFADYMELPGTQGGINPELAEVVADLAIIQTRTAQPVLIPDFDGFTWADIHDIRRAASLIRGQTVVRRWNTFTIERTPDAPVAVGDRFEVINGQYLRLRKITGETVLGLVQQHSTSVLIDSIDGVNVHCVPYKDDTETSQLVEALPDAPPGKARVFVKPIDDCPPPASGGG